MVAHGGSIMAVMSRYARPRRPFFAWHVKKLLRLSCPAGREQMDHGAFINRLYRMELFRR